VKRRAEPTLKIGHSKKGLAMRKGMRRLLKTILVLLVIGVPAYYAAALYSPSAGDESKNAYSIDIAAIRQLADSMPGDRPSDIRYEHVMTFEFAQAMVVAGDPWRGTPVPIYAYQLIYPDKTVIVDSAMNREIAKPEFMVPMYDDAAYARMSAALPKAALIVITHEHMDHIGGIAAYPEPKRLLPALRLTPEQLAHPERMAPAKLPPELATGVQPLQYEQMLAIAPGVVLIRSPGHTPGSQMVYIRRADGREILLLGDIAWHQRNIDLLRERPWFMTALIGENRAQVMPEFVALKQLAQSHPEIRQVPGHDGDVVQALTQAGLMTARFQP
jgi:glyoxylase-like metal-dependent hydrolase (beta-lactamase superfamily II)